MAKIPHLPITRYPTYEIYVRFAPNTLETVTALRKKYTNKPIYPRDIGIRLFRGILKSDKSTEALNDCLSNISSLVAPFHVNLLKPFRNNSAEKKKYLPSVYYEINKWPFNVLCVDLRILFNKVTSRRHRPEATKSFKIGITGEVESYEVSDRIVKELEALEKPQDLLFDAFVLATRPNKEPLSELEQQTQEFLFTATKETFKNYLDNVTAKRDKFVKQKLDKQKLKLDQKKALQFMKAPDAESDLNT